MTLRDLQIIFIGGKINRWAIIFKNETAKNVVTYFVSMQLQIHKYVYTNDYTL